MSIVSAAVSGNGPALRLLAIGMTPQFEESGRGDFRMFFSRGNAADAAGFELDVLDGQVVRYAALCRPITEAAASVEKLLLRPPKSLLPTPTAPDTPETPSTGIAGLDEIIAALMSGDRARVTSRMVSTVVQCDSKEIPVGPNCRETEAPLTPVESFLYGINCYPSYIARADATQYIPLPDGMTLYAAYRGVGPVDRPHLANGYTLVFAPSDPSGRPLLYEVRDGGIVSSSDNSSFCGTAAQYARGGRIFLVPPPERR